MSQIEVTNDKDKPIFSINDLLEYKLRLDLNDGIEIEDFDEEDELEGIIQFIESHNYLDIPPNKDEIIKNYDKT